MHFNKNLSSSIVETNITINNYSQDIAVLLDLRNLFDQIELDEHIIYCKANLLHDNHNMVLRKRYLTPFIEKDIPVPLSYQVGQTQTDADVYIQLNSISIKIKPNLDTNEYARLEIYKNGNYTVKTSWREENHMTFKKIVEVIQPYINKIITHINKLGNKVKYYDMKIPTIEYSNVIFTETSVALYCDLDISEAHLEVFKRVLEEFRTAGIIDVKESTQQMYYEYYFRRGMYKFDVERLEKTIDVQNYYEYMSNAKVKQKWDTIFSRTRSFKVVVISSKIQFYITGIRDNIEMDNFHLYLFAMLSLYENSSTDVLKTGFCLVKFQ